MSTMFGDDARVQGMLDFEAALARAQAAHGVIPQAAVAAIEAACHARLYDVGELGVAATHAGNPCIPLIERLRAEVAKASPDASRYVHFGATSQDAIDTGMILQARRGIAIVEHELERSITALVGLVTRHRDTVMVGRTWLQHAVPITFGLKAAGWLSALCRDRDRLHRLRARALCVQLGGAAGTLAALGQRGLEVADGLARELGLTLPDLPWHTQRDRVVEIGSTLGLLLASGGKLARDVSLLSQSEVLEVCEPSAKERGGSSSMPQKRNPVGCAVVLACAVRGPGLVSTLLTAAVQEHERGLGGWQAEWEALPELFRLVGAASLALSDMLEGLHVDEARMRANLELSAGQVFAERVAIALAEHIGKPKAHALVEQLCRTAQAAGRHLREELAASAEVRAHFDEPGIAALFDANAALGVTSQLIDRVLARAASGSEDG
jgi:3-carboxy-cis,cis-muconate cycloisomerase